jgi:S1-C subfamily serine protease
MTRRVLLLLFVGACATAGGSLVTTFAPRLTLPAGAQVQNAHPTPPGQVGAADLSDQFEAVALKVLPAVVAVEARRTAQPTVAGGKARQIEESGSGVLIKAAGWAGYLVLTNNHVVTGSRPDQITVHLADGRVLIPAKVWTDPESDIAVLGLNTQAALPVANLGDSDRMRVGQWVLAMGSPFGLNQTVTHGIVSARERGQVSLGSTIRIKDFIQTDAAINPGSSGGPLVNLRGEVIGINTAIASLSGSNSGVSFSIPINQVKRVAQHLLERGSVPRGYLGMQLAPSFEPADALKLGMDRVRGAWVERVYANTPAAAAGLRDNDVVLQVESIPIRNDTHLINLISTLSAGQRVQLQVWRAGKQIALDAEVGDWTKDRVRFGAGR